MTPPSAVRAQPVIDGSPATLLGAAAALAVLVSTQFFFQPFVWRHWPLDEIVSGLGGCARRPARGGAGHRARLGDGRAGAGRGCAGKAAAAGRGRRCGSDRGRGADCVVCGRVRLDGVRGPQPALVGHRPRARRHLRLLRQGADQAEGLARQQADAARLATASLDAEAAAMQRQIEPHFLFNTLATARRHYRVGNEAGRHLLERLLTYIEDLLSAADARWSTVGAEVDLAAADPEVCVARMAPRLDLVVDVPDALRLVPLPPLMLVTLAENAIKHGVAPLPAGGRSWYAPGGPAPHSC